jgi:hypothetical protein
MSYCALDEAFLGPVGVEPSRRPKKNRIAKDAPPPLPDQPTSETPAEHKDDLLVGAPTGPVNRLKAQDMTNFFPIPGDSDSWEKAFMMESDFSKTLPRPEIVAGKPTLWRQITPTAPPLPPSMGPSTVTATPPMPVPVDVWSDMNKRLDTLTKQLDNLTSTANTQSTSELFMFVAIGLLLLLAIDTILRFASTATTSQSGGSYIRTGKIIRDTFGRFRRR